MARQYTKPYKKHQVLINLMKKRGLTISNETNAIDTISYIGYYRMSGYAHPFLKTPKTSHIFHNGVSFEDIINLYQFDKNLRILILNQIEKIEIGIRAVLVSEGTEYYRNPYWMTQRSSYRAQIPNGFRNMVSKIRNEFDRSNEDFAKHFRNQYLNSFPPAWILSETLTFGSITFLYSNLKPGAKLNISKKFGLMIEPFESWIGILHLTRNICCHHSRLWNRWNSMNPSIPINNAPSWIANINNPRSTYFNLCVIKHFVDIISPNNDMADNIKKLLTDFPIVYPQSMGFPANWQEEAIWKS